LTNNAGCDSTVTLHLTINHSTTGDTTATACDSLTWYGNTYDTTSTHIHLFTNKVGCDSTVTLHLTIKYTPVKPTVNVTQPTCGDSTGTITVLSPVGKGLKYSIDGLTYTDTTGIFSNVAPGNYFVTANSGGCISVQSNSIKIDTFYETLAITYPAVGSKLYKGITDTIKWNSNCSSGKVKIDLFEGSVKVLQLAGNAPNTGSFPFNPPSSLADDNKYRIAVSDTGNKVSDTSSYFAIATIPSSITITYPQSGDSLFFGIKDTIKWNSFNVTDKIKIALYKGNAKVSQLISNYKNSGFFPYNPPSTLVAGNNYRIAISDSNNTVSDTSLYFTITTLPVSLTITYPNSGDTLLKKVNNTIKWNSVNVNGKVKISLYKGNVNVLHLASRAPNTGTFVFDPPTYLVNDNNYRIVLSDTNSIVSGASSYFTIASTSPEITFSGDMINGFGDVPEGTELSKTLTITNTGYKKLVIDSLHYPTCLSDSFYGNWPSGSILVDSSNNVTVTCKTKQVIPFSGWINVYSNSINGKDSVIITVTGVAGIEVKSDKNIFNVYPIPATNDITIESMLQTKAIFEICNLQGQVVTAFTPNSNKTNIDISSFPCGMYFISLKTEKGITVEKFVKE
jgi:hypothetical protein